MYVRNKELNFFKAVEIYSNNQDTIIAKSNNESVNLQSPVQKQTDTVLTKIPSVNAAAIDSILRRSQPQDSFLVAQKQEINKNLFRRKTDTTELLYKQFGIAGLPVKERLHQDQFSQNFLYNMEIVKPVEKQVKESVFIESEPDQQNHNVLEIPKKIQIRPQYTAGDVRFDWITMLLIATFLLLGWVRLFNKKYLISLIKSVVNVQESGTLFREKNSLMERASFLINLLFVSNLSVFSIQIMKYFRIVSDLNDYILYFIIMSSLLGLYIFRFFSSSLIGYVFLKQKVFSEYFHNVNIYTKNTGIALFPIVVILQFSNYNYSGIILYIGLILISVLYLLQLLRAFQIIIRKNVSIFYMILYLCAFEFVPFLIVYKLLLVLG